MEALWAAVVRVPPSGPSLSPANRPGAPAGMGAPPQTGTQDEGDGTEPGAEAPSAAPHPTLCCFLTHTLSTLNQDWFGAVNTMMFFHFKRKSLGVSVSRESEAIIPNIFFFLVLLSYERYHSKQIIGIPKIIQLCDGIMASGRKAVTHGNRGRPLPGSLVCAYTASRRSRACAPWQRCLKKGVWSTWVQAAHEESAINTLVYPRETENFKIQLL